ncbi:hypothetical protein M3I54_42395 [Paraburkholderia sp. CNPSo 3274]|uniref:hypothetical protein n=1 Tax=Paraburkholderia sp. CNPSo 3281 TaxID=2940933 RepID=UPI0020B68840|nr:hypothetical protein [Paraburkholderia sp. CNPSo 3281]MCP3713426.1 hypothetical protein [Paraburkholderia sp. CNPSo 3274]MCP3721228.1 hypothetical protein [Paraburkholderia sp. CNPSo 3281]
MKEHTIEQFFIGDARVDASITMRQGGERGFWIENWHGRYHAAAFADYVGTTIGDPFGAPLLPAMPYADMYPPEDVLGTTLSLGNPTGPEQYTITSRT